MSKKLLILLLVLLLVIVIVIVCLKFIPKKHNINNYDCEDIDGGSFYINFDTGCDNKVGSLSVCIGCPPEAYDELPIPKRDNYVFEGWYYDKNFEKKVEVKNTMNITPVPFKNDKGCVVDYQDITLYAKWSKR